MFRLQFLAFSLLSKWLLTIFRKNWPKNLFEMAQADKPEPVFHQKLAPRFLPINFSAFERPASHRPSKFVLSEAFSKSKFVETAATWQIWTKNWTKKFSQKKNPTCSWSNEWLCSSLQQWDARENFFRNKNVKQICSHWCKNYFAAIFAVFPTQLS